jgi:hypothetical protein
MLQILCAVLFATFAHAAPAEVSGTVTSAAGVTLKSGGVLFIFAKEAGKPMPVAVLRVPQPSLPFKFTLSAKNAMVPGTPFVGPFQIVARYSQTGDAMDKSGPEGATAKPVKVGTADLKLELKSR